MALITTPGADDSVSKRDCGAAGGVDVENPVTACTETSAASQDGRIQGSIGSSWIAACPGIKQRQVRGFGRLRLTCHLDERRRTKAGQSRD